MLTDKQIDEIDELAPQEKMWNFDAYPRHGITPDTVRSLTIELKRQRRLIAAVRHAWLDERDHPLMQHAASEWVRGNWQDLAVAPERLAQNDEWS